MDTSSDTIRRDLLITFVGIIAACWFFFDFSAHHPLRYADASLGAETVSSAGIDKLVSLGYSQAGDEVQTVFRTRGNLLNRLQDGSESTDYLSEERLRHLLFPTYWNLDVHSGGSQSSSDAFEPGPGPGPPSGFSDFQITFDQNGEWREFKNPSQIRPTRLAQTPAIRSIVDVPAFFLNIMRADSVVLNRFSFDFSETDPVQEALLEEGRITFTQSGAYALADFYIEQSGWSSLVDSPSEARLVSFDNFDAAEVLYSLDTGIEDLAPVLSVRLSPGGALLGMDVSGFNTPPGSAQSADFIFTSLRGFLIVILALWLIILLYVRIQARVVDIKPALLVAVLAGLLYPAFEFSRWLYTAFHLPESPELLDFVMILMQLGIFAALSSILYFLVSVTGDSITRQHWQKKIATLDLVRGGYFYNRPVGLALIHSVGFSLLLALLWSLLFRVFPDAIITVPVEFQSDTVYLSPFVHLAGLFLVCLLLTELIYLVVFGQLTRLMSSKLPVVFITATLFSFLNSFQMDVDQDGYNLLFSFVIGLGIGGIYLYRDYLTALLSFFLFTAIVTTADAWIMESSPDVLIFYPVVGLCLLGLGFGFVASTHGRQTRELPTYVPDYIEDLAQDERIKQELQIARKVQQSFLPAKKPDIGHLDIGAVCIPAYETGGDYYDFIRIDENRIAVTIGDVSGKGFQAAFYMTFIKGVLHALCREYVSSVSILNKANDLFYENARRGTFISLIFGVIELNKREFMFSRAGHNPLLHYRASEGRFDIIKPNGLAIGMVYGQQFSDNISEQSLKLEQGDLLILFTDGIVEAENTRNEYYGQNRLQRLVEQYHNLSSEEIVKEIISDVSRFTEGAKQHDDMTLVIIQ